MRKINRIVVHCSATKEGVHYNRADIDRWHRQAGYRCIGYHYVVYLDGTIATGRPIEQVGAHAKGYNESSIAVCYIGGLSLQGKPKDTRTEAQRKTMLSLLRGLKSRFPSAVICGHRDLSPDINHNGIIEPFEFIKACPCFDAKEEYKDL